MGEDARDPWGDDKLGRAEEAEDLIAYLRGMAARGTGREDAASLTLAVDAGYGEGKTFFLKRLAKTLSADHPVAYVDAWADDVADEPLIALAATLQRALEDVWKLPEAADGPAERIEKTWRGGLRKLLPVAKAVGTGILRRAAATALTEGGVDAVTEAMGDTSAETEDAVRGEITRARADAAAAASTTGPSAQDRMAERLAEFQLAKDAVREFREQLAEVVAALGDSPRRAPIFIIVDELDRCRPTYAIKLLEEIKHLFDVPGVVFVLGLNMDQLARSLAAPYGPTFDGHHYLRRFIGRRYDLREPGLEALVTAEIDRLGLDRERLETYAEMRDSERARYCAPDEFVAHYIRSFGFKARDVFAVAHHLETALAVSHPARLVLPYLLPWIFRTMLSQEADIQTLVDGATFPDHMELALDRMDEHVGFHPNKFFRSVMSKCEIDARRLARTLSTDDPIGSLVLQLDQEAKSHRLAALRNYPELVDFVGRIGPDTDG